jgi:hypothetical protein
MPHIGIGGVDEGLHFAIDGGDDVTGQQIVDDDGAIFLQRLENLPGRSVSPDPLDPTFAHW